MEMSIYQFLLLNPITNPFVNLGFLAKHEFCIMKACGKYPTLPCATNTQASAFSFFLDDCIEVHEQKQAITCIPVCAASLLLSQEH